MTEQSALIDQIIERCKDALFTGILRVRSGPGDGELWFLSGIVEQVRFGVSTSDEAMDRLRKLTDARVEVLARLPSEAGSFKKGHPLDGSLSEHLPVELLNFCETQALTCTVELESAKGVRGSASYKLGELISIHSDVGTDRAVAEMLEWNDGTFRFVLPNVDLPEGVTRVPDSAGTPSPASTPPPARTTTADDEDRARRDKAETKRRAEEMAARQRSDRDAARKAEDDAQREQARRKAEEEAARRKAEEDRAARARADEEAARRKADQRRLEEPKRKANPVISDAPPRAAASNPPRGAVSDAPRAVASEPPKPATISARPVISVGTPDEGRGPKRMGEDERRRAAEELKRKAEEVMRRKTADTEARKAPQQDAAKAFFSESLEPRKAPASVRPEAVAEEAAAASAAAQAESEAAARRAEAEIAAQKEAAEAAKAAAAEAAREKAKPAPAAAPEEDDDRDAEPESVSGKKRKKRKSRTGDSQPPAAAPVARRQSQPSLPALDAKKGMPAWVWLAVAVVAAVAVYMLAFRR